MVMAEGGNRRRPDSHTPRTDNAAARSIEYAVAARSLARSITDHELQGDVRQWGGYHGIPISPEARHTLGFKQLDPNRFYVKPYSGRERQGLIFRMREDGAVVAQLMDPNGLITEKDKQEVTVDTQGHVTRIVPRSGEDEAELESGPKSLDQNESRIVVRALQGIVDEGARRLNMKGPGKLYTEAGYALLSGQRYR